MHNFIIFEASDGVGGTWRSNSYPGAACDVPSHLYSYSFEMKPDWTKTYANQPEILAYFEHCADKYDLRRHLQTDTAIVSATWMPDVCRWRLRSAAGEECEATVLVSALGLFHEPNVPDIEGLASFCGASFHSARWDHAYDVTGRRVAVIGTGASAAQIVPAIAPSVEQLTLFQRTPSWILPRVDMVFSDEEKRRFATNKLAARRHRWEIYRSYERNISFRDGDAAADQLKALALSHLDYRIKDDALREKLTPTYPLGCKRTLVTSDFYKSLVRDPVDLVTEPIARVTPDGVMTTDGVEHRVDAIVWATGFRASDYLQGLDITGVDHRKLHDEWGDTPEAYLGMTVPGYPNFFMLYGPNTNQGGNSIIFILEAQAAYIVRSLRAMRRHRTAAVDVKREVKDTYNRELQAALSGTVWDTGCESYFKAASGQIVTQLPHPSLWYWRRTRRFRMSEYLKARRTTRTG
jgi:cation diffusion facilitator CzcD-associated flavoprotein CzcO